MSIFHKATVFQTNIIREGIKIVRKVLATHDCSKGLTTAELYQLALREPAPPGYKSDPQLNGQPAATKGIAVPPHNDHPVRSKVFLKRAILPALVSSKEIIKVVTDRETMTPIPARGKKGKTLAHSTKETVKASPSNPALVKAWVWKPCDPTENKQKTQKAPEKPLGVSVGVGEDWSHLNKRRRGAREEKVQRDWAVMKQLQAQTAQAS